MTDRHQKCGGCPDGREWTVFLNGHKLERCVWARANSKADDPQSGAALTINKGKEGYTLHRGRVTLVLSAHFQKDDDEHSVH